MTDHSITYVQPHYRMASGRHTCDGVLFISYRTGISRYTRISEDGQIQIWTGYRLTHYTVSIIGHGFIMSPSGNGKARRFRNHDDAMRAGVALFKKFQAEKFKREQNARDFAVGKVGGK